MLRGFYRVNNLRFELRGYDRLTNYQFYLECDPKIQKVIDKGFEYEDEFGDTITKPSALIWGKEENQPLYIQVSEDKVAVSKYTARGVRGASNRPVAGFFKVLGALLTGCKTQCRTENTVGYTDGFGLSADPDATQEHVIKGIGLPVKKKLVPYTAFVERKFSKIKSITLGTDATDYQLVLEDDGENFERVVQLTKTLHRIPYDISLVFPRLRQKNKEDNIEQNMSLRDNLLSWEEIQDRHPDRNYGWLRDRNYKVVTDFDEMVAICDRIMKHDGIVAFDTETTGLNFTFEGMQGIGDQLVGMVFSIEEGEAWYFPVRHKSFPNICNEANEYTVINKYFKPILEQKDILCHNATFDEKVMFRYGIITNLKEDTMVILRLSLSLKDKNAPYGLKKATQLYLERDSYELDDLVSTGEWTYNFAELPIDYVQYYACADTDNTLALYHWIKDNNIFDKFDLYNIYYNIELPFTSVVAYSEYFGMIVDMDRAEELDKELNDICKREEQAVYDCAGHKFKITSAKELREVLFEEMGCPVQKMTKAGEISTDKDTIKKLAKMVDENGEPRYPITAHLKAYRDANKLITGFTNLLNGKAKSENNISASGVISSSVQPFLVTSRVSVNKPNYQSFNDTVKHYIIPRDGYYMIDADYSSVEYRITASMSGQKELIEAFYDPDTDYHKLKASLMFQIPYEDVSSEMRRMAKSFNFGILYGMGYRSLAELLFGNSDPDSVAKATKLYELYFKGQENVRAFFENGRAEGVLLGRSRTYFGGYRYYDSTIKSKDKIEKESGNHKIQGTAANIYKIAMSDLYRKIIKNGWWGKVLISGFIHDECLLEASCDINPALVMKALRDSMMLEIEGWCPLYTGMGCGANWDDAKHVEIPTQVQEDLLGKYGETGFPWWKGDCQELYDNMKQFIYDYKRDRVLKYLENPENKGTQLPLVENDLAHEVISAVNDGKYTNGVVDKDQKIDHDVLVNLFNFCKMFGKEDLFEKAQLKPKEKVESNVDVDKIDFKDIKPTDFAVMNKEKQDEYMRDALEVYGMYKDSENDRVYLLTDDKKFLAVALKDLKDDGDYEVWVVGKEYEKPRKLKKKIEASDYLAIQQAYMATH